MVDRGTNLFGIIVFQDLFCKGVIAIDIQFKFLSEVLL